MKKVIFMLSLVLTVAVSTSCTSDVAEMANSSFYEGTNSLKDSDGMLKVKDRQALHTLIDNGLTETTRALGIVEKPVGFVSLMDIVSENSPALDTLSQEERDTILNNHLSYYEAFGYENIIPNENFAHLINWNGEISVNDTVYAITDIGTFYTKSINLEEMRFIINNTNPQKIQFSNGDIDIPVSGNVRVINSFIEVPFFCIDSLACIYGDDFFPFNSGGRGSDSGSNTGSGNNSGTGNGSGSSSGTGGSNSGTSSSNTSLSDIPFGSFPEFSAVSHTFVGNILEKIIGERHARHHEFKSGYRVTGSLYYYNYGIYNESGTYVKMEKKRGGWLKKINGWKGIDADELVLHVDSAILTMNISAQPGFIPQNAPSPQVVGSGSIGSNNKYVEIMGYEMTENQINNIFAHGLKEALKSLSHLTNASVSSETRSFLITTKEKAYLRIYDFTLYGKKQHKLRNVFKSGTSFGVSYKDGDSFIEALIRSIKSILSNPHYKLDRGQVRLAGRLDNNWGGMTIVKK